MSLNNEIFIHPSAIVDLPVSIGARTKVWHFCHVMNGATLGTDCVLGQNVFIAGNVVIGNACRIQNNVSVYDGVTLEDEVFLGPSCVFTNVRNPRAQVRRRNFEPTRVLRGATLGANCTVVAGCTIGRWAFIGAGSVVVKNVPDYALVVGNPARRIGWVSRHGARLNFIDSTARCPETDALYRLCGASIELLEAADDNARQT